MYGPHSLTQSSGTIGDSLNPSPAPERPPTQSGKATLPANSGLAAHRQTELPLGHVKLALPPQRGWECLTTVLKALYVALYDTSLVHTSHPGGLSGSKNSTHGNKK